MFGSHWDGIVTAVLGKVPFVIMTANGGRKVQLNTQKITESLVTAAILAILGYLFVVPILEEKVKANGEKIDQVLIEVKEIARDAKVERWRLQEKHDKDVNELRKEIKH